MGFLWIKNFCSLTLDHIFIKLDRCQVYKIWCEIKLCRLNIDCVNLNHQTTYTRLFKFVKFWVLSYYRKVTNTFKLIKSTAYANQLGNLPKRLHDSRSTNPPTDPGGPVRGPKHLCFFSMVLTSNSNSCTANDKNRRIQISSQWRLRKCNPYLIHPKLNYNGQLLI